MPYGTQENGVKRPQLLQAIVRHHFPGSHVALTAPIKGMPCELKSEAPACGFEDANAFRHYFSADPVAFDYCDLEGCHRVPLV